MFHSRSCCPCLLPMTNLFDRYMLRWQSHHLKITHWIRNHFIWLFLDAERNSRNQGETPSRPLSSSLRFSWYAGRQVRLPSSYSTWAGSKLTSTARWWYSTLCSSHQTVASIPSYIPSSTNNSARQWIRWLAVESRGTTGWIHLQ